LFLLAEEDRKKILDMEAKARTETAQMAQQQLHLLNSNATAAGAAGDQTAALTRVISPEVVLQEEEEELLGIDLDRDGPAGANKLYLRQLNDVDESALGFVSDIEYPNGKTWKELTARRRKWAGNGQAKNGKDKKSSGSGKGMGRPGQSAAGTGVRL